MFWMGNKPNRSVYILSSITLMRKKNNHDIVPTLESYVNELLLSTPHTHFLWDKKKVL